VQPISRGLFQQTGQERSVAPDARDPPDPAAVHLPNAPVGEAAKDGADGENHVGGKRVDVPHGTRRAQKDGPRPFPEPAARRLPVRRNFPAVGGAREGKGVSPGDPPDPFPPRRAGGRRERRQVKNAFAARGEEGRKERDRTARRSRAFLRIGG